MKVYYVKSVWAGKYTHSYNGVTPYISVTIWWFIKWSVLDAIRVLRLNKYHYGNIFGIGKKITDCYGRKPNEINP
jgi:hypothetical protein